MINRNRLLQAVGLPPLKTQAIQTQIKAEASNAPHSSVFKNYAIWGIDISKWQGVVNFKRAKAEGIRFVIAKCSEGYGWYDPTFAANMDGAGNAGLALGAYHFVRPGINSGYQIDTIRKAIKGWELDLDIFCLDCEVSDGMNLQRITKVAREIAAAIPDLTDAGIRLSYSRASWWDPNVARSPKWAELMGAWPAHWGVKTPRVMADWSTWMVWQAGIVSNRFGVSGDVDFDVWNPVIPFPGDTEPLPVYEPVNVKISFEIQGQPYSGDLARE